MRQISPQGQLRFINPFVCVSVYDNNNSYKHVPMAKFVVVQHKF